MAHLYICLAVLANLQIGCVFPDARRIIDHSEATLGFAPADERQQEATLRFFAGVPRPAGGPGSAAALGADRVVADEQAESEAIWRKVRENNPVIAAAGGEHGEKLRLASRAQQVSLGAVRRLSVPTPGESSYATEEPVFLEVFWRCMEHVAATKTYDDEIQAADAASRFFTLRGRLSAALPISDALVSMGRAYGLSNVEWRGHALRAAYAHQVADREAFRAHASEALRCAAIALDPERAYLEMTVAAGGSDLGDATAYMEMNRDAERSLAQASHREYVDPIVGAGKGRAAFTILESKLTSLLRQVAREGHVDLLREFAESTVGLPMTGEVAYRIALACAEAGEPVLAASFQRMGHAGLEGESAATMATIEAYRGTQLAQTVPILEAQLDKQRGLQHAYGSLVDGLSSDDGERWDELVAALDELHKVNSSFGSPEFAEALRTVGTVPESIVAKVSGGFSDWEAEFEQTLRERSLAFDLDLDLDLDTYAPHERALFAARHHADVDVIPYVAELETPERIDLAVGLYVGALELLEQQREGTAVEDRATWFETDESQAIYRGLLRSLALRDREGDADRALAVSELTRARQLKDLVGAGSIVSLDRPTRLATELRSRLGADEAVVAYHLLPEHLLTIVATMRGTRSELTPVDRDALRMEVAALHDALSDPASTDVAERLRGLAPTLLDPIRDGGGLPARLYVLPDGFLATVPIGALPLDDDRPLVERCCVTYLPGVEWLLREVEEPDERAPRLLAFADPIYEAPVPALPETREEVEGIRANFGAQAADVFLGAEAREGVLKEAELKAYTHLHFATHGALPGDLPQVFEPSLVLSPEVGEDSLLTATEAERLQLNAEVTVLSACNTGSGEILEGEGVMGLSRAFLVAGSNAVVVSLWPVASDVTRDVMVALYRAMDEGESVGDALRVAQLEIASGAPASKSVVRGLTVTGDGVQTTVRADSDHPFFWAPFIVIGGRPGSRP